MNKKTQSNIMLWALNAFRVESFEEKRAIDLYKDLLLLPQFQLDAFHRDIIRIKYSK